MQFTSPNAALASQPLYQNFLVAVSNGFIYYGHQGGGALTLAAGQSTALLNPTVNVSMTFLNLIVYIVDGTNFVQLDLATGIAATVINVESPPSIAVPANPALSETPGGGFGSTNYLVRVAYLKNDGSQEVTLSGQSSTTVDANNLLVVTHPTPTTSVSFYQVYAAFLPLGYTLQTANNGEASFGPEILQSTVSIGVNWTMPTTGLVFAPQTSSTGVTIGTGLPVGITPSNCSLITNWRGRLVLAGDAFNPQNWYMSRAGNPLDWDFSQTDVAAAVAGNNGTAGRIGEPITCLIPFTDDLMKFGTVNSLWMMQGDPADGGTLTKVSDKMGIVAKDAWCVDPAGTLYFVATGGLYSVRPAWEFYRPPELMTGNSYDQFFSALSWSTQNVALCWDEDHKYLEMFVMPSDGSFGTHLIFDQRGEFAPWPQKFPTDNGPSCVCRWLADGSPTGRITLFGGQDGFIRKLDFASLDDDGQPITASITLGPFKPMPEASILTGVTIDFGEYFGAIPPSSTTITYGPPITSTSTLVSTLVISSTSSTMIPVVGETAGGNPGTFVRGTNFSFAHLPDNDGSTGTVVQLNGSTLSWSEFGTGIGQFWYFVDNGLNVSPFPTTQCQLAEAVPGPPYGVTANYTWNVGTPVIDEVLTPFIPVTGDGFDFVLAQLPIYDGANGTIIYLNGSTLPWSSTGSGVGQFWYFESSTFATQATPSIYFGLNLGASGPPYGVTADYSFLGTIMVSPSTVVTSTATSTVIGPFSVTATLASGPDAYEVTEGTPHSKAEVQVVIDRRTKTFRQRLRGAWFSLNLFNNFGDAYFSFESAALEFEPGGKIREYR